MAKRGTKAKSSKAVSARAGSALKQGRRPGKGSGGGVAVLGPNSYGKSRVRMMKVIRDNKTQRHDVHELTVDVALEGDFEAVHTRGDNSKCLPTDTMKNTVYALGLEHPLDSIESFALHLANYFVENHGQVSAARVRIAETPWSRMTVRGRAHQHSFVHGGAERSTCEVIATREYEGVLSGIKGLVILKSTNSAFSGYPKDRYTSLQETRERIFCTSVTATWNYPRMAAGAVFGRFNAIREKVRRALLDTFADHKSESVQQTLFAMGEAALNACPEIDQIRLSLPNKHYLLVNLSQFGPKNENEIFTPTDEPHGLIEATVERRR